MTLTEKLDAALAPLGIEFYRQWSPPTEGEYGVYDQITESPELYADDRPNEIVTSCNVHLFVKGERNQKKRRLRQLLLEAGFCMGDLLESYEADTGYTHFIIEDVEDVEKITL